MAHAQDTESVIRCARAGVDSVEHAWLADRSASTWPAAWSTAMMSYTTHGPDVIWFPAQVPETYSYTLSVALATGVPIVAAALGVFPERLASHADAILVPWDAAPGAWNDALLRAGLGDRVEAPRPASAKLPVS